MCLYVHFTYFGGMENQYFQGHGQKDHYNKFPKKSKIKRMSI